MSACIDLTGQKFGQLLVLKRVENTKANKAQWLCRCDCGEEIIAISSPLKTGKKQCCPTCSANKRKAFVKDLTGQRFGRLVVIGYDKEYSEEQNKKYAESKVYWKCQCDCGNITYAITASLNNGKKQSCGCLQKEKSSQNMKKIQEKYCKNRIVDLTGQRFGKLVVKNILKQRDKFGKVLWACKCDCGREVVLPGSSLKQGVTKSCGCLGNSVGEWLIRGILEQQNIKFKQEYSFSDLKDKSYLRYDFAILDNNNQVVKLIEYDGRQHSNINDTWYSEDLVKRDNLKTEYAKHHNIPLLRISYLEQDNIENKILDFIK